MLKFLLLCIIVVQCNGTSLIEVLQGLERDDQKLSEFVDNFTNNFQNEYWKYEVSGVESPELSLLFQELYSVRKSKLQNFGIDIGELALGDRFVLCTICRATVNVIKRAFLNVRNGAEKLKKIVLYICRRLKLQSDDVCAGAFDFNWPYLEYIIKNTIIDSRSMCGTLPIKICKVKQNQFNWKLKIDENDPNPNIEKSDKPQKGDNDLVVLHLTDIHYDPLYKPGALADCGEALCCQRENTIGAIKAAGYWSDYRDCDSPWHMITDALAHIKRTHKKIDMIYNTGDIVDHMVWGTSKNKNKEVLTKIYNLLEETFPGIPVYSSIGNHEPHPLNLFSPSDAPTELNVNWLYDHLNSLWRKWLPANIDNTVKTGGYYTVLPKPGFRIISLNNNDCHIFNWWIYYNGSYAISQLNWLHDTLLAAEKTGEYVHILLHIPSGGADCWTVWAREFNRIVERYRHIISGMFAGHTHYDELNLHYTSKGHAVGVTWNGASLTSFTKKNPNYKMFRLTPNTMEVVDFETWIFNLTEANMHGPAKNPQWFKEYVFSEEFQDDLSPAGIKNLLQKMADNPKLLRKFWRFKHTLTELQIADGCDKKCLSKVICSLSTTVYDQETHCKELQKRLEVGLTNEIPDQPDGPNDSTHNSATAMKLI